MEDNIEHINKSNKKELLILAKQYKIEKYSKMKVAELRNAIKKKIHQYINEEENLSDNSSSEDERDDVPIVKAINSIKIANKFDDISFFD